MPDQIWSSQKPVIRNEANIMTKIRPVFNCSLKMSKAPSSNEAAFLGIDLMNNLFSLFCTLGPIFTFYCLTSLRISSDPFGI